MVPYSKRKYEFSGSNLWYLVGLITSDGCLTQDGRVNIVSKDLDHLELIKNTLNIPNKITTRKNRSFLATKGKIFTLYNINISNKDFYAFLLSIGLTQKKSLTLGELKIPKEYFNDFLRGEIDGDGSIYTWINPNTKNNQWMLKIISASEKFIYWLKETTDKNFSVKGRIYCNKKQHYSLCYGKLMAQKILKDVYYESELVLKRKAEMAKACIADIDKRFINDHRPKKERLKTLLLNSSYAYVGRQLNVSGNTIRRWTRKFGIKVTFSENKKKIIFVE